MFGRRRQTAAPAGRPDWRSFDDVAEDYDRVRAPVHRPPARDLVAELGPPAPGGLLDVGAGTGVLAAEAQEAGWSPVVGTDRSVPMLALARPRGLRVVASEVIDLPFGDGRFGAIGSTFALHTFPKLDTALYDMLRVLAPGGHLGTATWARQDDEFTRAWRSVAEAYATKDLLDDAARRGAPWQELLSDPARVEETLRGAGLRDVRVSRRHYRVTVALADYLTGRETSAAGRFLRATLGEALWERFRSQVDEVFRTRFPDPIGDSYDVLLAVGVKQR